MTIATVIRRGFGSSPVFLPTRGYGAFASGSSAAAPLDGWVMTAHNCPLTFNVCCKHARATRTYFIDLDKFLPDGVTVTDVVADTDEGNLLVVDDYTEVLIDTVLVESSTCHGATLYAGRAILITLSGGEPSDDEVIVTVSWTQSDGDTGAVDCRLVVSGRAAP